MYSIYRLNADELDARFLKAIKEMFPNKNIEIAISEAIETGEDETAYLLQSPANRERLLEALENVSRGEDLVAVNLEDLK